MARPPCQPLDLAFLEGSEKFGLQLQRQVADLVQEQCAAVGSLEPPDGLRDRPGEGSALVTEEFAFEQTRRNRGAVDRDKALMPARTGLVNRLRDQFLSGAGFPSSSTALSTGATIAIASRTSLNAWLSPII